MIRFIELIATSQTQFINLTRIAICIAMVWIVGIKTFRYDDVIIVHFVDNTPLMSFFYSKKTPEYTAYNNTEGKTVQKHIDWHQDNGTYIFSYGLGAVIIVIGILTLLGIWFAKI